MHGAQTPAAVAAVSADSNNCITLTHEHKQAVLSNLCFSAQGLSRTQQPQPRFRAAGDYDRSLSVRPLGAAWEQVGARAGGGENARVLFGSHRGAEFGKWRDCTC